MIPEKAAFENNDLKYLWISVRKEVKNIFPVWPK